MDWQAFDLRPDTPPEGLPRQDKPGEQKIGKPVDGHLGALAEQAGLTMIRAGMTPYTRPAMAAGEYAKTVGKFDELHLALFKAYWERGENLGDGAVLQAAAAGVGIDPAALAEALDGGAYAQQVQDEMDWAHRVGITGIPAFVVDDRYLLVGAQPYEVFKQLMDRVLEERRTVLGEG